MPRRDDSDSNSLDGDSLMINAFDATPYQAEWTHEGHVAEESVYAWLDGALATVDADAVEQHVRECVSCAAVVAEARGFIAASARIMNAADLSRSVGQRGVVARKDVSRAAAEIVALADRSNGRHLRDLKSTKDRDAESRVARQQPRKFAFLQIAAAVVLMTGGAFALLRGDRGANLDRASITQNATGAVATASTPEVTQSSPKPDESKLSNSLRKPEALANVRGDANGAVKTKRNRTAIPQPSSKVASAGIARDSTPSAAQASQHQRPTVLPNIAIEAPIASLTIEKSTFATAVMTAIPPDNYSNRTITGKVTDRRSRAPLATANVYVAGDIA